MVPMTGLEEKGREKRWHLEQHRAKRSKRLISFFIYKHCEFCRELKGITLSTYIGKNGKIVINKESFD